MGLRERVHAAVDEMMFASKRQPVIGLTMEQQRELMRTTAPLDMDYNGFAEGDAKQFTLLTHYAGLRVLNVDVLDYLGGIDDDNIKVIEAPADGGALMALPPGAVGIVIRSVARP